MLNFTLIDFDTLQNELGKKLAFQLLNNFYLTYQNFNNFLSIDNNDLYAYVHKLKGASGNLKIKKIFEYCLEIESTPKNEIQLEKLVSILNEVLQEISTNKEYFDVNNESISKDQLKKSIEELLVDIDEYNYIDEEKIEIILNSLKSHTDISDEEIEEFKLIFAQGDYSKLREITLKFQELI